jgi:hypothetical protein
MLKFQGGGRGLREVKTEKSRKFRPKMMGVIILME